MGKGRRGHGVWAIYICDILLFTCSPTSAQWGYLWRLLCLPKHHIMFDTNAVAPRALPTAYVQLLGKSSGSLNATTPKNAHITKLTCRLKGPKARDLRQIRLIFLPVQDRVTFNYRHLSRSDNPLFFYCQTTPCKVLSNAFIQKLASWRLLSVYFLHATPYKILK